MRMFASLACVNILQGLGLVQASATDRWPKKQEKTKRKTTFTQLCFGPGVLACATRGGGRSEAGHKK